MHSWLHVLAHADDAEDKLFWGIAPYFFKMTTRTEIVKWSSILVIFIVFFQILASIIPEGLGGGGALAGTGIPFGSIFTNAIWIVIAFGIVFAVTFPFLGNNKGRKR